MKELFHRFITPRAVIRGSMMAGIFLLINACLEPYFPPRIQEQNGFLVVDGFLVPNDTTRIKIMRTKSLASSEPTIMEQDASVKIESENGMVYPLVEKEKGVYVAPPMDLSTELTYRLRFQTQDAKDYASEYVALKPSALLDSATWEEDTTLNHEAVEFKIYAHDPTNKTRYYLWTYDETWEYNSAENSQNYFENGEVFFRKLATELYYCWKTVATNNIYINSTKALSADRVNAFTLFRIPQSDVKLYFEYSILVRQYALTEGAYNYWAVTKKNSEELGTLFDPLPSQPAGNFHSLSNPDEPVIGFFAASTVATQRISLTRQQIIGPSKRYSPTGYEDCVVRIIPPEMISEITLAGKLIHKREYDDNGNFIGYSVGSEECLDCRKRGGSTKRPAYWD